MGLFLDEATLLAALDFYEQSGSQFAIWDGWGEKPGFSFESLHIAQRLGVRGENTQLRTALPQRKTSSQGEGEI